MCAAIAMLQDFRQEGPLGDIGVFQGTASVIVYSFTFSGVTYIVAQRMMIRGWILICPPNIDAVVVIQAALNALTIGRTWKETVVLIGNFTILSVILILSYTYLDLSQARLFLGNNINLSILQNGNFPASDEFIEVFGGHLDGNKANGNTMDAINFVTNNSNVIRTTVTSAGFSAIYIKGTGNRVIDCVLTNSLDGVWFGEGSKNIIKGNTFSGNNDNLVLMTENEDIIYGNFVLSATTGNGYGIRSVSSKYITIIANLVKGNGVHGIYLSGDAGVCSCLVIGNYIVNNGGSGIYLWSGATKSKIRDNYIFNNTLYGIDIGSITCSDNEIAENFFSGNTSGPIRVQATQYIRRNIGFVTENSVLSATFTIDSTGLKTVTIAHGLAVTPAKQDCALTVVEETDVDDWRFDFLKVDNITSVNVVVKINVSTASATATATARIALRVGKP